jgi:hypothetical protein
MDAILTTTDVFWLQKVLEQRDKIIVVKGISFPGVDTSGVLRKILQPLDAIFRYQVREVPDSERPQYERDYLAARLQVVSKGNSANPETLDSLLEALDKYIEACSSNKLNTLALYLLQRSDTGAFNQLRNDNPSFVPDFSGADFSELNLQYANLSGAALEGARFIRSNLRQINLDDARLRDASFLGAFMLGASLWQADLRKAYLYGAKLPRADLVGANLEGANLRDANLEGADLRGANLLR